MSQTASPLHSPNSPYDEAALANPELLQRSTSSTTVTRTVAIIKTHALNHRFDIERRIQEASFEIVKERQMEFDTETDPEALYDLFGDDADSLAEGAVWVYVLERRRAVEVWHTLMGNADPEVARFEAPNSLRALFGTSFQQNALMGSPDAHTAEIQISSLFASSPPFPTTDLPDDTYNSLSMASMISAITQSSLDEGYAPSNPSTKNGSKTSPSGKPIFRARPLPVTHIKPDIVPRMSRAAALRTGMPVEKTSSAPRTPISKERLAQTFANVPGHKRTSTIAVASTAAPVIAPRMTRAASLRLGQPVIAPPLKKRAITSQEGQKAIFEGIPGHKRRESISVASSQAPTVAPRLNKSAALRAQKDNAPPTSFMFRRPTTPKVPGLSRTNSQDQLSPPQPAIRPASQAAVHAPPVSRYAVPRPSSVATSRPPISSASSELQATTNTPAKPKPKPRPSSFAAPSIAPRTNRSAALRAAKQEAENQAAVIAAARKNPRAARPPSSFKTIAA